MLTPLRAVLFGGSVTIAALANAGLAFADGSGGTQCIQGTSSCTVQVSVPGSGPSSSLNSGSGGSGSSGGGKHPSPSPSPTNTLTVPEACTYTADPTYVPPAGTDTHAGQKGAWYVVSCPDSLKGGVGFTSTNSVMWLTNPPPPPPPSAQQLAAEAAAELKLPAPAIGSSPAPGSPDLVDVPVWVWAQPASWSTRSATATAAGVSVTATATPVSGVWSFGDGTSITCDGPGTVYTSADGADSSSPTCGHTYARAGKFTMTATVTWKVTWAGAGQSGVFNGMTTTSSEPVTVEQSNAVVTG